MKGKRSKRWRRRGQHSSWVVTQYKFTTKREKQTIKTFAGSLKNRSWRIFEQITISLM